MDIICDAFQCQGIGQEVNVVEVAEYFYKAHHLLKIVTYESLFLCDGIKTVFII